MFVRGLDFPYGKARYLLPSSRHEFLFTIVTCIVREAKDGNVMGLEFEGNFSFPCKVVKIDMFILFNQFIYLGVTRKYHAEAGQLDRS